MDHRAKAYAKIWGGKVNWKHAVTISFIAIILVFVTTFIIATLVQAEEPVRYDPGCTEVHKLSSSPATCDDEW
jgi:uncharacterized membrane protein (DUF485 family)